MQRSGMPGTNASKDKAPEGRLTRGIVNRPAPTVLPGVQEVGTSVPTQKNRREAPNRLRSLTRASFPAPPPPTNIPCK